MDYHVFLDSVSQSFATKFEERPRESQEITIDITDSSGMKKPFEVKDICFLLSLERFRELAQITPLPENFDDLITKIWSQMGKGHGTSYLEIKINTILRIKNLFYDLVIVPSKDGKRNFLFRESSDLITQQPQTYLAPILDAFELIQEIKQGEYAIVSAMDPKPILASWHFATCIGFVAFNEAYRIGILAHIDLGATYGQMFQEIKRYFKNLGSGPIKIDYVLTGGSCTPVCTDAIRGESLDLREHFKAAIQKEDDDLFQFILIQEIETKISAVELNKDASWGSSMRLNRSIALDTRKTSPLSELMSYEARLNPDSSLHKREGTQKEAIDFSKERLTHLELKPASLS